MPIKKEELDSIKGYREYQKKSGAAAAVSSPAPSSYTPAQKPARVKQDKREQIYTYYRSVSTPKMTAQERKTTSPVFRQQPTTQQNVVMPKMPAQEARRRWKAKTAAQAFYAGRHIR